MISLQGELLFAKEAYICVRRQRCSAIDRCTGSTQFNKLLRTETKRKQKAKKRKRRGAGKARQDRTSPPGGLPCCCGCVTQRTNDRITNETTNQS